MHPEKRHPSRPAAALALLAAALAAVAALASSCAGPAKDRPRIGAALRSFDDPRSAALRRAIEAEALDKADLAVIDGHGQAAAQALQVRSFLERGLAAVAMEPVDVGALGELIAEAKGRAIPIVFFGRPPSDASLRSWDKLYFAGTRPRDMGAALGEILAEAWKARPGADRDKDGAMRYRVLGEAPDLEARLEGLQKALDGAGIKAERLPGARDAAAAIAGGPGSAEAVACLDLASTLSAAAALGALGPARARLAPLVAGSGEGEPPDAVQKALTSGLLAGAAFADLAGEGKAVVDLACALARKAEPAKSGLSVTDAKFVWVPVRKYAGNAPAAPGKK